MNRYHPLLYIYIWTYLDDILRWWTEIPWKMETLFFPDRKHGKPKMSQSRPLPHGAERDLANNLPPILVWMKWFLTILEAAFWNLRFFFFWGETHHFPGWSCHDFDVHDMDRIRLRFGNPPKNIDELEKEVGKDKHLGMERRKPSLKLTYPLPRSFWRWVSFSLGGRC